MRILLLEDDDIDVEYFVRSLSKYKLQIPVQVASNGIEALAILRQQQTEGHTSCSWLVVTDIQMPLMNGFEFLHELRTDLNLRSIVTFVLTSSVLEKDKIAAYEKQIAGYLVKSDVHKDFKPMADLLRAYQTIIILP